MKRPTSGKDNWITQAQARTALRSVLVQTRTLDTLNVDSLARSYRVPRPEIEALLAEEALRRQVRP